MDPSHEDHDYYYCDRFHLFSSYYNEYEYFCEATPLDDDDSVAEESPSSPNDDNSNTQYFNMKITHENMRIMVDRYINEYIVSDHFFSNIPKDEIQQRMNSILFYFVYSLRPRDSIEKHIVECANKMANVTHRNHRVMSMRVVIKSVSRLLVRRGDNDDNEYAYIYSDDDDDDEDEDEDSLGYVRTSKSSIERLEKVKVEEEEFEGLCDCSICLEDLIKDDVECVRMPCLHLFHRICIVRWLKNHNTCPLCRFQMPTGDSDQL